ncbi:MAG TPA: PIN domain-containing protein [Candidatus Angelobacter sp.]
MDRLFLDANVLFSAAYRDDAGLLDLWKLKNVHLCSSQYALAEAKINLPERVQVQRLENLSMVLELFDAALRELPDEISLPPKDAPILLAAIEACATHLITGDMRHFGPYFGKKICGILIVPPGDYLRKHAARGLK